MRTRFITSCAAPGVFPDLELPEVAFAGRSNVGKSALLNALVNARIARTSRTPGRTQLVNFFSIEGKELAYGLADLPGYGYARAPKAIQRAWGPLIESYLETRARLRCFLLLVDVRRGAQDDDRQLMGWMQSVAGPRDITIEVVGTKIDKLPKSKQKPALHQLAAGFGLAKSAVHGTSASTRQGLDALRQRIETLMVSCSASSI